MIFSENCFLRSHWASPVTVRLLQDIYIYEYSASSCYLPELSKGLVPYVCELHVGRAKGFIVVKGDDTKLPTPEKQKMQFIFYVLLNYRFVTTK